MQDQCKSIEEFNVSIKSFQSAMKVFQDGIKAEPKGPQGSFFEYITNEAAEFKSSQKDMAKDVSELKSSQKDIQKDVRQLQGDLSEVTSSQKDLGTSTTILQKEVEMETKSLNSSQFVYRNITSMFMGTMFGLLIGSFYTWTT